MMRALTVSLVSCLFWCPVLVAQKKEDPKPAEKKSEEDARDAKAAEMDRLRKRIEEAIRRAKRRGGARVVNLPPAGTLKKDAVHKALAEVQQAVERAQKSADLQAMQDEINKAEKALMKARQELWKKLRAEKAEKEKKHEKEKQPTKQPDR